MTRTHEFVGDLPQSKLNPAPDEMTPMSAALGVAEALKTIEGRWKFEILFCLFGGRVCRFSDLERSIKGVSQKMLAQQLRQLEKSGMVRRVVYPEVPPKVEYALTEWGQTLCPVLDALLKWKAAAPSEEPANT
ncbi:MAG: helix-turn-helix domain-containing protein [Caulobacterales bacterium]